MTPHAPPFLVPLNWDPFEAGARPTTITSGGLPNLLGADPSARLSAHAWMVIADGTILKVGHFLGFDGPGQHSAGGATNRWATPFAKLGAEVLVGM
jgi:hypothetical protein